MRIPTAVAILVVAVLIGIGVMITRTTAQPPRAIESAPFTLTVDKHYEIYMPERRGGPDDGGLVFVLKTYPNGWADVRTQEGQLATINVNQVTKVYRIDDVEKWKRMRGL